MRLLLLTLTTLSAITHADVRLPALLADGAVLQRDAPIRVWGWSDPGETVVVQLAGASAITETRESGEFEVLLPPLPAGGPHELVVRGGSEVQVSDLLVGDVWVCSGQSNMEWPMERSSNPAEELAAATLPRLRLFQVDHTPARGARPDVSGSWQSCTPQSAAGFSAVGFHFGRSLASWLEDVPVGLIQTSWGGTRCEAWTPRAELEGYPDFEELLARSDADEVPGRHRAGWLWNGMVAPLTPHAIRGWIWYQGEANTGRAAQYAQLFPLMIQTWRQAWGRGDLPFLYVQLTSFRPRQTQPGDSSWAELREAQDAALRLPATGAAITLDVGDAKDIHPRDKRTVGERLARSARRVAYGDPGLAHPFGPRLSHIEVNGRTLRAHFDTSGGLATADGAEPVGFALAGADRVFHWAKARIEGDSVVLSAPEEDRPLAVRYAWADNPAANLVDGEAIPAGPFRSDGWPGITIRAR